MAETPKTKSTLQDIAEQQTSADKDGRVGKDRGYLSLYGYKPDTSRLESICHDIFAKLEGR